MTTERPYRVSIGSATCTKCKTGMTKSFIPDLSTSPYCKNCINFVTGIKVLSAELNAPSWTYEIADRYVNLVVNKAQNGVAPFPTLADLQNGIFVYPIKAFTSEVFYSTKSLREANGWEDLTKGQRLAISSYIHQKFNEVQSHKNNATKAYAVCPECAKTLYYKGGQAQTPQGVGTVYRCLSKKGSCSVSDNKQLFAYLGNHRLVPIASAF